MCSVPVQYRSKKLTDCRKFSEVGTHGQMVSIFFLSRKRFLFPGFELLESLQTLPRQIAATVPRKRTLFPKLRIKDDGLVDLSTFCPGYIIHGKKSINFEDVFVDSPGILGEKFRVVPTGVEPTSIIRLLAQIFSYGHRAIGCSSEV